MRKTEKKSKKKRGVKPIKRNKKKDKRKYALEIAIDHQKLKEGDKCPECGNGTLYKEKNQRETVYEGQSPFVLKVFLYAVLRCRSCGTYFRAEETENVRFARI